MAYSDTSVSHYLYLCSIIQDFYNMASLKELTKEQKCSVYMFMDEYDKSIHGNNMINPVGFYISYGIGWDELKKFRDGIKEEERFSYAISILKEVQNDKLFRRLLDDCYSMLMNVQKYLGFDSCWKERTKLLELFKNEFGYDHLPISEMQPDAF